MATPVKKAKARGYVRRSRRFPLHIPVVVYGRTPDDQPFRDHTTTLNVDAHGARISVTADLHVWQKQGGRTKIGIEFLKPSGNFWHVYAAKVESKLQPANAV